VSATQLISDTTLVTSSMKRQGRHACVYACVCVCVCVYACVCVCVCLRACEKHVSATQLISDTTLVTSSMDGKVGMHVLCVLVCIHVCVCVHIAG
jgi:hypothetical protein